MVAEKPTGLLLFIYSFPRNSQPSSKGRIVFGSIMVGFNKMDAYTRGLFYGRVTGGLQQHILHLLCEGTACPLLRRLLRLKPLRVRGERVPGLLPVRHVVVGQHVVQGVAGADDGLPEPDDLYAVFLEHSQRDLLEAVLQSLPPARERRAYSSLVQHS